MNKFILILFSFVIFLTLPTFFIPNSFGQEDKQYLQERTVSIEKPSTKIFVTRVIDGDTIQIKTGEKVQLIGIDAPEIQGFNKGGLRTNQDINTNKKLGSRAYEFTRNLVEGKMVSLEFDIEKRDKYGRLLAYVYLDDGTFVNAEIIKQGYASLMTIPPNVKYADLFLNLYREARENKRGLWK